MDVRDDDDDDDADEKTSLSSVICVVLLTSSLVLNASILVNWRLLAAMCRQGQRHPSISKR